MKMRSVLLSIFGFVLLAGAAMPANAQYHHRRHHRHHHTTVVVVNPHR